MLQRVREFFLLSDFKRSGFIAALGLVLIAMLGLMFYYDHYPARFNVELEAIERSKRLDQDIVVGYVTTATLAEAIDRLLDKRGGYLTNDVTPPSVMMDNVPSWEFGVLTQIRDLARAMHNDISRSQTQSTEDMDLASADSKLHFDADSWMFPRTESEYHDARQALGRYLDRLGDIDQPEAQFYARADNLRDWLALVEKSLGSLSQRLSASVGPEKENTDLSGDSAARQSTPTPSHQTVKTPWLEIDDVFYEARGASWALIHFLKAAQVDFAPVLEKKNAHASLAQIIRDLESTQGTVWSPMILNGTGFGFTANHSLVMASYISQANAAIIDLKTLLSQG